MVAPLRACPRVSWMESLPRHSRHSLAHSLAAGERRRCCYFWTRPQSGSGRQTPQLRRFGLPSKVPGVVEDEKEKKRKKKKLRESASAFKVLSGNRKGDSAQV